MFQRLLFGIQERRVLFQRKGFVCCTNHRKKRIHSNLREISLLVDRSLVTAPQSRLAATRASWISAQLPSVLTPMLAAAARARARSLHHPASRAHTGHAARTPPPCMPPSSGRERLINDRQDKNHQVLETVKTYMERERFSRTEKESTNYSASR